MEILIFRRTFWVFILLSVCSHSFVAMLHFFIQGGLVCALGQVEPWDEGISKIQGAAPYFSNALTLWLYPTHNLYLGFFFLHTSSRQRMVMDFCPLRGGLCFLVHRQKGYETFHPPTWELWGCFKSLNRRLCLVVTSERTLVTGNNFGAPVPQLLGAPKSFPITSIL